MTMKVARRESASQARRGEHFEHKGYKSETLLGGNLVRDAWTL